MAKGSGTTRASAPGNGGRYINYTDEDTGEVTRVFISERELRAGEKRAEESDRLRERITREYERVDTLRRDIGSDINDAERNVENLQSQRRALMSDMEDELGGMAEGRARVSRENYYGRRLNAIDTNIGRAEARLRRLQARYDALNYDEAERLEREYERRFGRR